MTSAHGSFRAFLAALRRAAQGVDRASRAVSAPLLALCLGIAWLAAAPARGGELQEYVRLRGLEGDRLVGMGLVYGLNGTGDSMKDSTIAAQPYAQLLKNLGNIAIDLRSAAKTRSVALVLVTLEIPRTGARTDDRFDVTIGTYGTASSLEGGQLVTSFLKTPVQPANLAEWLPFAVAEGELEIDPTTPTKARIRGGARMVRDVIMDPLEGNSIALVLHPQYAGYPTASSIADLINDELSLSGHSGAARVEDAGTIRVRIPEDELNNPNKFIAQLMTYSVPSDLIRTPARIVIDRAAKVITVDERVEFRPAAVTAANLRITTVTPEIEPTEQNPVSDTVAWTGVATGETKKQSMRLKALIDALIEVDVPFETQVAIIKSLEKQGALKAQVIES
ncbi:MAG: flagellar P-ring protein [Planctomycetota bacterium]